jgi:four helix bundle protein
VDADVDANVHGVVVVVVVDCYRITSDPPAKEGLVLTFQKLDVYCVAIEFLTIAESVSGQSAKATAAILDQLRRAASSIPLNIAEGTGRTGSADMARHFAIARGSAMECAAALDVLRVMKAIDAATYITGNELLERIVAMLTRMCR